MVNEDRNNLQEFVERLYLLAQQVPQILKEKDILEGLVSFHEQQVELEVEKRERQKQTYKQEKFDLENKNEELNISLQKKVEEIEALQTELSKAKEASEILAQEIEEKDKLFEEEKDKLNGLVNQGNDKVKLVISRSTEIRKNSSKTGMERELVSLKKELAEKIGNYEKTIAKLQGEKTKAEKRAKELETTNKEKENLKYDLAILQKKLDKVTEEKNIFQEKNRELTKNVRKERSSSLSSPTGSTNNSCDSLSNLSQKKTFAYSLRKRSEKYFSN